MQYFNRKWNVKLRSILTLTIALSFFAVPLSGQEKTDTKNDGYQQLFDGKSLEGWSGNKKIWSVQDGAITGETTKDNRIKANTFLIWQGKPLEDFELKLKFRISGNRANSGIQFRSVDKGNHVVGGYQADIDITGRFIGILYEERGRGILAQRGKKVERSAEGKSKVVGTTMDEKKFKEKVDPKKWCEFTIIARGNHIVQKINGITTVDFTDNETKKAASKGILALQCHVGPPMKIQFKDIRLKRLGSAEKK